MKRAEFIAVYTRACLDKWKAEGARVSELVMSEIDLKERIAPRLWRKHRAALLHFTAEEVRAHVQKAGARDTLPDKIVPVTP